VGSTHRRLQIRKLSDSGSMGGEYDEHPPLFLGMYPLTIGVQVVCLVHALICILVVSLSSSVVSVEIAGIVVSPHVQACIAAWHLLGVAFATAALVGTSLRQSQALQAYLCYLLGATLAWCAVMSQVFQATAGCDLLTANHESQRTGMSFSCGIQAAMLDTCAVTVLVGALYACWMVWHLKDDMCLREGEEQRLDREAPLMKKLQGNFASGMAVGNVGSQPGPQPQWGSVRIQTCGFAP